MLNINNILWGVFNYLNILIYFLLYSLMVGSLSKKNYIILIILSIGSFIIKDNITLISILSCTIFYKLNCNENIIKCIISSSIYWLIIYRITEKAVSNLIYIINYSNIFAGKVIDSNIVMIESIILKVIILIILYIIYKYFIRMRKLNRLVDVIIIIPILTNLFSLLTVFRHTALSNNLIKINILEFITMPSLILISNTIFFIILKKMIQSYSIKYENKILKDRMISEYGNYLKIKKEQDKVTSIHHDMRNHMICIRDLCENNEIENIINYVDNIEFDLKKYNVKKYNFNTGSLIVDSILKNKKSLCDEKEIHFDVDVDFSKSDFIEMTDVCIMFSNIIDNAIDACSKIQLKTLEKRIRIEAKYIESFCIIVIENTKLNKIRKNNNKFLTNKDNSFFHGIGLKNVKKVVKKYSGELMIEYSETKFILKIMIPC